MGLDIRIPIGFMFSAFGIILTIFGFVSDKKIYAASLGVNINLVWGLVLLAFGLFMLVLGRNGARRLRLAMHHQKGSADPKRPSH